MEKNNTKKIIYISLFTLLGILLQFLVHIVVETWYIGLLVANFAVYSFGFSWAEWFLVHHILAIILFTLGAWRGFTQGKHWWHEIYETPGAKEKLYKKWCKIWHIREKENQES